MKRLGFSVLNHEVSGVNTVLDAREWMGAVEQPFRFTAPFKNGERNELQLRPPFTAQLGLPQSNENAVEWYQKKFICPQNSGYRLGKAYKHGELGLPQNDKKAATAYLDAADRCIAECGSQHTPYGRSGKVYRWYVVQRIYKAHKNGELGLETASPVAMAV